jgi:hypothetical protein
MKLQVDEILDRMSDIPDMDTKIKAMDDMCKKEPYLWSLLKMAVDPKFKIDRLAVGFPKRFRPEKDLPVGISDTNIRTEFRRIQNYCTGGPLKVLDEKKLEDSWVALLQGLNYREAVILTHVKDQTLCDKYPDLWVVLPALGIETCINTSLKKEEVKADLPSVETVAESPKVEAAPAKKQKTEK